jgi:hypothetical protein
MAPIPKIDARGRGTNYPLSIVLAPREVEFVVVFEKERSPRGLQLLQDERYQYSDRHQMSRVACPYGCEARVIFRMNLSG